MNQYPVDEYGLAVKADGSTIGGIRPEALDVRASVEASNYSLLNPYLDIEQRALIEVWDQLPVRVFYYCFLIASSIKNQLALKPVFIAIYASLLVGLALTCMGPRALKILIIPFGICNSIIAQVGIAIWAVLSGSLDWGSVLIVFLLTLTGLLSPGGQLACAWASSKYPLMHPKYGASKVLFNIKEYAFEKYLTMDSMIVKSRLAEKSGREAICWLFLVGLLAATVIWG